MTVLQDAFNNLFIEWEYASYLKAIVVFALVFLGLMLIRMLIARQVKSIVKKTKIDFDDLVLKLIDSFGLPFYFILSFFAGISMLDVSNEIELWIQRLTFIAIVYYIVRALNTLTNYAFRKYRENSEVQDPTATKFLAFSINILTWIIAALIVLQNFGYNVSALIGGLGIAGIAIAFALQSVLEDIFSFFSIYFDKPFKVGDFVVVGNDSGTVKKVGIKSTRIKTLQGEELVVSNKELTSARVNNYKRLNERRVEIEFGVTYETPSAKLEKLPKTIEDIVTKIEGLKFNRAHLKKFGDFALIYEVVFIVQDSSYEIYMDLRQQFNLELIRSLEKEDIEFAYPTNRILVENQLNN